MSFKGKTYSKKGGASSKHANPFDRMMKEQCNKPVAAKSAGIVGKWGATSFTSVRVAGENQLAVPRPKKFFKSRSENVDSENAVMEATLTSAKILETTAPPAQPDKRSAKKFFLKGRNSSTDDPPLVKPPDIQPQRSMKQSPNHRTPLERSPVDWSPVRPPLERSPLQPSPARSVSPPRVKSPPPVGRRVRQQQQPPAPGHTEKNSSSSSSKGCGGISIPPAKNKPAGGEDSTSLGRERRIVEKRKLEGGDSSATALPPIKLKLSLRPAAQTSSDTEYKVIRAVSGREDDLQSVTSQSSAAESDTASDRTDLSNGHQLLPKPSVANNVSIKQEECHPASKISASDFDSLFTGSSKSAVDSSSKQRQVVPLPDTDSQASEESRGRRTVGSRTAARKAALGLALSAALSPPPPSSEKSSRSPSPVRTVQLRKPISAAQRKAPDAAAVASDIGAKADKVPAGGSSAGPIPDTGRPVRRKPVKPVEVPAPKPVSPPDDDFGMDFPKRVIPVQRREAASRPAADSTTGTYKKKIFKTRGARVAGPETQPVSQKLKIEATFDEVEEEEEKNLAVLSRVSAEPPRVPPVSKHCVEVGNRSNGSGGSTTAHVKPPAKVEPDEEPSLLIPPSVHASPPSSQELAKSISKPEGRHSPLQYPTRLNRKALDPPLPPQPSAAASPAAAKGPMKRSIFKSKAEQAALPKKALSLYRHNLGWGGQKEEFTSSSRPKTREQEEKDSAGTVFSGDEFDREFESEPIVSESDISFAPSKLTRVATYPTQSTSLDEDGDLVTQVKCPKSYKEYFTVIKNVKKAHEINDFGEFQEFNDDVDYIIDGLSSRHKISLRCLTCISLASKCMKPSFRMHLRAHSVVSRFFAELKDAPSNPSLALCTSTVLFVLSQDRLNMDMDRDSLELMLNLLDTDSRIQDLGSLGGIDHTELAKNKQKVIDICTEMQKKGHAASLNLNLISADHLSMETLLSMTSKRAGEWFKEELRELGGLGHLSKTFSDCVNYLTVRPITVWSDTLVDKLKKANRILRVLENVSNENEENCNYLLSYRADGEELVVTLQKLFKLLDEEIQLNPTTDNSDKESVGVVIRETLFSIVRVHINVVHDYSATAHGSLIVGQQPGFVTRVLRCLFIIPFWFIPLSKRFECLVLALTLLTNMVENSLENRQSIMDSMAAQKDSGFCVKEEPRMAVEDLVQMFLDREQLAAISEEKTDNILDCVEEEVQEVDPKEEEKRLKNEGRETLEETVQRLISKAGSHMESTLIAAYVGLVIGYLILNSDDYECRIREYLPTRDFKPMVSVLNKLFNFMKMTGTSVSSKSIKATQKIITYLEKLDAEPEPEPEEEEESALDFSFDTTRDETTLSVDRPDYSKTSYGFDDWGKL